MTSFPLPHAPSCPPPQPHLHIELLKLVQVEDARGTVLEEAFVPLLELCLVEFRALGQVVQDLRSQLTVVFTHDECTSLGRGAGREGERERERETGWAWRWAGEKQNNSRSSNSPVRLCQHRTHTQSKTWILPDTSNHHLANNHQGEPVLTRVLLLDPKSWTNLIVSWENMKLLWLSQRYSKQYPHSQPPSNNSPIHKRTFLHNSDTYIILILIIRMFSDIVI